MLKRIAHWLNAKTNFVADEATSRELEYWDRVEDHRPWCVCPTKAMEPELTCQTHHSRSVGDPVNCAPHMHGVLRQR
jgi:hypothetical protein